MKWSHVAKHWHAFVPNILTEWPDLDSDEVEATEGELGPFLDHLCEVTGMSREDARDEVSEWLEGTDPADAVMDETRDNERIIASASSMHPGEDAYSDDSGFGDDDSKDGRDDS